MRQLVIALSLTTVLCSACKSGDSASLREDSVEAGEDESDAAPPSSPSISAAKRLKLRKAALASAAQFLGSTTPLPTNTPTALYQLTKTSALGYSNQSVNYAVFVTLPGKGVLEIIFDTDTLKAKSTSPAIKHQRANPSPFDPPFVAYFPGIVRIEAQETAKKEQIIALVNGISEGSGTNLDFFQWNDHRVFLLIDQKSLKEGFWIDKLKQSELIKDAAVDFGARDPDLKQEYRAL